MSSGIVVAGLAMAAVGFAGRYLSKHGKPLMQKIQVQLPAMDAASFANSKYYKGGFDQKMDKREASLILGVSPSAHRSKIKEAHKRIMVLNHPDKGGSPYLAAKINEAKDLMDNLKK
ncbi:putative Mitochondrial import inner membrane translocase subunit TIM14 [Hypsibius exemplaris]|uniref:Mitochondrial import inner membrane translocase subunit TIM14 n=1 Tax=Hypsibius exemplaris TaxID=2072580 RepID=A0A1W0X4P4_HYPEX|nr:putative Mitochondrial import inner membrane translocase subunit TIM14 [Hypsibius exemplaris]